MGRLDDIRLIVVDMDGTLLDDQKQLDTDIFDVIQRLKKRNILFTLASGRNIHIMKSYIEALHIEQPCITNNGALIFQKDLCLYEQNMAKSELKIACSILQKKDIAYIAYAKDVVYIVKEAASLQHFLCRLRGKTQIKIAQTSDQMADDGISKVVFIHEDGEVVQSIMHTINTCCTALHCERSEDCVYTITHRDATKGKALRRVLDILHIAAHQVLVFGDNFNDISMFKLAGICVAMQNSQQLVKDCADYITLSNNERGVSTFIRTHILKTGQGYRNR